MLSQPVTLPSAPQPLPLSLTPLCNRWEDLSISFLGSYDLSLNISSFAFEISHSMHGFVTMLLETIYFYIQDLQK